jgi:aminoglycoside 6-adenylyltransferase
MRSEKQMLDLILETARCDERIRAAIMNGSRADPNARRDPFQDFDIVYIVTDVAPFRHNMEWIRRFGELMILQMPEEMVDPPPRGEGFFTYLMQFMDGNRVDLRIFTLPQWREHGADRDSLSLLLLDKDGLIAPFPPASDIDYLPQPPTAKQFADCCNEFWWDSPYAAKGLWRQEVLYAKQMLDGYAREQLMKMLRWHIGLKTNFQVSPGKMGKYFQKYLEPELWEMLQKTYSDAGYENTWDALFTMSDLFRKIAIPLAEQSGFAYPFDDDRRVTAHLKYVRALPQDARELYP